jgi:hypothetical protein
MHLASERKSEGRENEEKCEGRKTPSKFGKTKPVVEAELYVSTNDSKICSSKATTFLRRRVQENQA